MIGQELNDPTPHPCPACRQVGLRPFYMTRSAPANSCVLISSRSEAMRYPTGDIVLMFCRYCGFISNVAYDPARAEYSERYEASQSFSPTFNAFHVDLARRLIERYDLREKKIIEIGCGQGEFLSLLCELGGNRGVGFDPGYRKNEDVADPQSSIQFVKDYYSEKYAGHRADFVCCKMTLEHIHAPFDFVRMVYRSLATTPHAIVFFQVPDASRILESHAFEDIYYEHCSYFTPSTLSMLFERAGFRILNVESEYGGQYLTIEASLAGGDGPSRMDSFEGMEQLARQLESFRKGVDEKVDTWKTRLTGLTRQGKKIALWGSGSKASAFTMAVGLSREIPYVVDINPRKQGFYMAGTGQKIVSPDFLVRYRPEVVIVMNPVYREEIRQTLNLLCVNAEIDSL
jgi:SAM-dependent methyltransferase